MKSKVFYFLVISMLVSCQQKINQGVLYSTSAFSVYKNKIVQGKQSSIILSPTSIQSNYQSPASKTFSRLIKFKFSINEKDNELAPGNDHWIIIGDNQHEAPVVTFGEQPKPSPENPGTFLPVNYEFTFKVDVSGVLKQFDTKGYYEAYDKSRVAKNDFKGFYIAGAAEPLSWDFVNLDNKGLRLQPTSNPGIYSLTVKLNPYNENHNLEKNWTLKTDLSHRTVYTSEQPVVDALFNMALEEAIKNIEPDSTLRTGAKWAGVWTRDVSYSTLLAFAYHEPEVAKISLRKKVKRGRIIQDTGSGGAWPVSSDRTTWCLAAWEIYKVTGEKAWLDEIYPIIKNTLEDDYKSLYNEQTGMVCGESSFLDWREQTYPKWMDNRDIYVSQNLGTNVVHYQANRIMAAMAALKGDPSEVYQQRAEKIKKGINDHLWMKDKNYYGQYLYGRPQLILSPRFEALGEALAILFDVADKNKASSIMAASPLTTFGATCIFPQIPGIPPYHNNAIWPFVQSYWNWAAAKTGNEEVLLHGLASIYRAGGLFLTNYENMVAESGDFTGTEINSDRMLWSMAGNMAMVHRIFMGMDFQSDGLYFNPVVPKVYGGTKKLSGFKYRRAILNITVKGHGTTIQKVTINGQPADKAFIPANASGAFDIVMEMANNKFANAGINIVNNHFSLPTVLAKSEGNSLVWQNVPNAREYKIYKNGHWLTNTTDPTFKPDSEPYASYMVAAVDSSGYEGFASEPVVFAASVKQFEMENFAPAAALPYTNYSGNGFIELSPDKNRELKCNIEIEKAGNYLIEFRYANGSGPWNTDNKCAIRSLTVNNHYEGIIVLPQRGNGEWSDWGFSNTHMVTLHAGTNEIKIHFEDYNNNMNVQVNTAMIDYLRIIAIR